MTSRINSMRTNIKENHKLYGYSFVLAHSELIRLVTRSYGLICVICSIVFIGESKIAKFRHPWIFCILYFDCSTSNYWEMMSSPGSFGSNFMRIHVQIPIQSEFWYLWMCFLLPWTLNLFSSPTITVFFFFTA